MLTIAIGVKLVAQKDLIDPKTVCQLQTMDNAENCFRMPLFKPGTVVDFGGKRETVSHVHIRCCELLVHLVGHAEPVGASALSLAPVVFSLSRRVGR